MVQWNLLWAVIQLSSHKTLHNKKLMTYLLIPIIVAIFAIFLAVKFLSKHWWPLRGGSTVVQYKIYLVC